MKTLSSIEFEQQIQQIESKRARGSKLTLFELFLEACDSYNNALKDKCESERWYYEGKKNAYQIVLESGGDPNMLIED